jgi:glyoxylase-like metal-dependent hydrolase (beta-lactamase superfamily II)
MGQEVYRFNVGDFECAAIHDGSIAPPVSLSEVFPNAPQPLLEQMIDEYDLRSKLIISYTCLTIQADERLLLVDTGYGTGSPLPGAGKLVQNLRASGIAPEQVDTVILTHGDGDHIGGNANDDGMPTFPNARYVMWREGWEYYTSEETLAQMEAERAAFTRARLVSILDRIDLIDEEMEIVPGVRFVPAPGHKPGHATVVVSSNDEKLLCIADAIALPFQLQYPDWHMIFDWAPEKAAATRRQLLEWAAEEKTLVHGYHLPFPGLGYVVQEGKAWRWQPIGDSDV